MQNVESRFFDATIILVARQVISITLSLISIVIIMRILGPERYGVYAISMGVSSYVTAVGQLGLWPYLIRESDGDGDSDHLHVAFWLLSVVAVISTLLIYFGAPFGANWVGNPDIAPMLRVFSLITGLNIISVVPTAVLERKLEYRRVAFTELASQIAYYVVAVPWVFFNQDPIVLGIGTLCQAAVATGLPFLLSGYRPRFVWSTEKAKAALSFGLGFSASMWPWQLRSLINPVIIGRFMGAETVGVIAFAIRMADVLSFGRAVIWRVSWNRFGRIHEQLTKLRDAVQSGMFFQIIAAAPVFGFAMVGSTLLGLLMGKNWLPAMHIYPFIAVSYTAIAVFNLHSCALYVRLRNLRVAVFHITHVLIFAVTCTLTVRQLGIFSYGVGEISSFAAYAVITYFVHKELGPLNYGQVIVALAILTVAIFAGVWLPAKFGLPTAIVCTASLFGLSGVRNAFGELVQGAKSWPLFSRGRNRPSRA